MTTNIARKEHKKSQRELQKSETKVNMHKVI